MADSPLEQLVPEGTTFESFESDRHALIDRVKQRAVDISFYSDRFNPYPLAISKSLVTASARILEVTGAAMRAVVGHYHEDADLQRYLSLDQESQHLLRLAAKGRPYELGSLRPDILVDAAGRLRVCEINARFTMNGFVMSQYLAEILQEAPYNYDAVQPALRTLDTVAATFDETRPLTIVKGREAGYDIRYLFAELSKRLGKDKVTMCLPEQLEVRGGKLHNGTVACDQFVLELHQDELTALPANVLEALLTDATYFNDIRTILLGHDKRLFAVFSDTEVMKRYLSEADVSDLQAFMIPTYLVSDEAAAERMRANPTEWVLKKYQAGKGEDMYVGREDRASLLDMIVQESAAIYVAQPFIEQTRFPITTTHETLEQAPCHVVGMIPSFNGTVLGPGFCRASTGQVVNVSRKGGDIVSVVLRA